MIRLLLPLLGATAVGLAAIGAATASTGAVHAGPPANGSRTSTVASTSVLSASPALMLSSARPLVVHGLRFADGERVKVTFRAGGLTLARTVRATVTGSFALAAPSSLAYDPCSTALVVIARGTTGDLVVVKRPPRGCAPG